MVIDPCLWYFCPGYRASPAKADRPCCVSAIKPSGTENRPKWVPTWLSGWPHRLSKDTVVLIRPTRNLVLLFNSTAVINYINANNSSDYVESYNCVCVLYLVVVVCVFCLLTVLFFCSMPEWFLSKFDGCLRARTFSLAIVLIRIILFSHFLWVIGQEWACR